MNLTSKLLETLKKYLKAKGITYKELAGELGLSEATVKRSFAKQSFSLERLEEVCQVLDIDFYDLARMDKERERDSFKSLTAMQEDELRNNFKLLIFLYFLIHGWTIQEIVDDYDFSMPEATQMALKLEELSLLELHSRNQVRILISNKAYWRIVKPLINKLHEQFIKEFLNCTFEHPNEELIFNAGQFSEASLKVIKRKIKNLVKAYDQLAEMDAALPLKERYSTGMLIAFRPWVASYISQLRRNRGA